MYYRQMLTGNVRNFDDEYGPFLDTHTKGPNLAAGANCSAGFCYAPENAVVTAMTTDGKYYLALYVTTLSPPPPRVH